MIWQVTANCKTTVKYFIKAYLPAGGHRTTSISGDIVLYRCHPRQKHLHFQHQIRKHLHLQRKQNIRF